MSVNNNLQTGQGRIRVAQFTASGSWTAPAGVYTIQALAVGGGGGGGASRNNSTSTTSIGGGGGGGGVIDGIFPVVPGTTYTVTIGSGGAGANTSAAGSNGSDTTFGSLFTAPGGQGGASYLLSTGYAPTTNPGGCQGGWGLSILNSVAGITTSGGHGCGAGSPILLAAKSDALSVSDMAVASSYQYFDGYIQRTIPTVFFYEVSSLGSAGDIAFPSATSTTTYRNVKRNIFYEQNIVNGTAFIPGYSYKGLGAGGQSLVTSTHGGDPARFPGFVFSEPSAGKLFFFSSPNNSGVTSGTNGVANTGAGGGGSRCGGTNNTIASGGSGGSGYVEIVWQE